MPMCENPNPHRAHRHNPAPGVASFTCPGIQGAEPLLTKPAHDITAADIGGRVKAVSTHEDGTVLTYEGAVTHREIQGLFVGGHFVRGTTEHDPGWTVAVERIRPAVPTGLGAVVRLDSDDGPLAVLTGDDDDKPWREGNEGWRDVARIAARIAKVESEGWTP